MKWEYGRRRRPRGYRVLTLVVVLLAGVAIVALYAGLRPGAFPWSRGRSVDGPSAAGDLGGPRSEGGECVESQFMMDTYVSIRAVGDGASSAVSAAFEEMRRVETLMSRYVPSSDVSRINESAGRDPVQVSDETFTVIERALAWAKASGGAFDITIGPVVDAWGFGGDEPHVPDPQTLARAVALVDFREVEIDPVKRTVRLAVPGMSIDLGGIAKGYAADRAAAVLRERGIEHALIDAGGNIVAVGGRPDGSPWHIGIRDPRGTGPTDTIGPVVEARDAAVVTSGDYERFFIEEGRRYHHIFDPETGLPADLAQSATIVAPNSLDADALSTAVFVLGPLEGPRILEGLHGVSAMIVDAGGELVFSRGFPGQ